MLQSGQTKNTEATNAWILKVTEIINVYKEIIKITTSAFSPIFYIDEIIKTGPNIWRNKANLN